MKLYAKKNGAGYITTYQVVFGSKEAKILQLIDEYGNVKEIEKAEVVGNNTIQIKLIEKSVLLNWGGKVGKIQNRNDKRWNDKILC